VDGFFLVRLSGLGIKQHLFCKFIGSVSGGLAWEGEVFHSGSPLVTEFNENGGDKSQQGSFAAVKCLRFLLLMEFSCVGCYANGQAGKFQFQQRQDRTKSVRSNVMLSVDYVASAFMARYTIHSLQVIRFKDLIA